MITALDIIDRLPYELQARLEADEFFEDIPVVVAEEGNVKAEIAKKQAAVTAKLGRRGVAVAVLQIVADDEFVNLQFGPMTLRPAVQVIENVELNRDANGTKKSARKVARRIRDVFKDFRAEGLVAGLQPDKPCIEPVNLGEELGKLLKGYQVNFRCFEKPGENMRQVQDPQFESLAPEAMQVAISCPTEGAMIYYTTDDSYPSEKNPLAHAYADPIDVPEAGLTVRACAYVPGMIASGVNRKTITVV